MLHEFFWLFDLWCVPGFRDNSEFSIRDHAGKSSAIVWRNQTIVFTP